MNHETEFQRIRPLILERDKYLCRCCEEQPAITVHHLDGDRTNNHPRNLISLCQKCHRKIPRIRGNYMTLRMFLTKQKTTTKEGKKEYMKYYMRFRRANFESKKQQHQIT